MPRCPAWNLLAGQVQTHIIDGVRVAFSTSASCVSKKSAPTRLGLGSLDHDHPLGSHLACPCLPPPPVSHLRPFFPLSVISEAGWEVSVATEQPATMDFRAPSASHTSTSQRYALFPWQTALEYIFLSEQAFTDISTVVKKYISINLSPTT